MKVLKNGYNLNVRKGLIATILVLRTVHKAEVVCKIYKYLKILVNSKNELTKFEFIYLEKIKKGIFQEFSSKYSLKYSIWANKNLTSGNSWFVSGFNL